MIAVRSYELQNRSQKSFLHQNNHITRITMIPSSFLLTVSRVMITRYFVNWSAISSVLCFQFIPIIPFLVIISLLCIKCIVCDTGHPLIPSAHQSVNMTVYRSARSSNDAVVCWHTAAAVAAWSIQHNHQ
jgi:hypothetical protein